VAVPATLVATPRARVSPELRAFVAQFPEERGTILEFVLQVAERLPEGTRLADVGAGEAPYRELFAHLDYVTVDWEHSVHPGARGVDVVATAEQIPVPEGSFDAVLSTQVLEHVAEPQRVLRELHRVLRPGGRLFMTVPLAWELHEQPFDFYRYTPSGLEHLLRGARFAEIEVRPRNDTFSTLAQLLRNAGVAIGRRPDGRDPERELAGATLARLADVVGAFAPLDADWIFPLGYELSAVRPAQRAVAGARRFAVVARAAELVERPELLRAYAEAFSADDDATLVLLAPDTAADELEAAAAAAGLDADGSADVLALTAAVDERRLADNADALLSARPAVPPFTALPRVADAAALHAEYAR
jgi:SAM-dependent methyltransferase